MDNRSVTDLYQLSTQNPKIYFKFTFKSKLHTSWHFSAFNYCCCLWFEKKNNLFYAFQVLVDRQTDRQTPLLCSLCCFGASEFVYDGSETTKMEKVSFYLTYKMDAKMFNKFQIKWQSFDNIYWQRKLCTREPSSSRILWISLLPQKWKTVWNTNINQPLLGWLRYDMILLEKV